MDLPPGLAEHLAQQMGGRRRRKPKDVVAFPREHTRRLLELAEASTAAKGKMGYHQSRLDLWNFIREKLPITQGNSCSIDTTNARFVMVEIHGKCESFTVGETDDEGRKILAAWPIPKEHVHRLLELADADSASSGPLARYELWDFLAGLIPEIDKDPGACFTIRMDNHWLGVLQVEKGEDDA
jgi:hypothetical protein